MTEAACDRVRDLGLVLGDEDPHGAEYRAAFMSAS
jgi:hypothetical protein